MSQPPAPLSAMSPDMSTENQSHHNASSALSSSHLPFQPYIDNIDNIYHCAGPSDHPPPLKRKHKRAASPEPAEVGGYGPIPGSPSERTERSTPDPPPAIGYTGRKNTAYNIWMFTRAVETNKEVAANDWPDDYGDHLTKRPGTTFVGCKFCTQFG